MKNIAVFTHPACLKHDTGPGHPESPARLEAILDALKSCAFTNALKFIEAPLGTREQVMSVHTKAHLERVENAAPSDESLAYLDPDTVMSQGSLQAALRAVGAASAAVNGVLVGDYASAFCAIRPPGHHATPDRAMGFCLFNTIAIAAQLAIKKHGLQRVAIVDFDVHHGNGTQAAFERDPAVLYISTHQWPHYPGTGSAQEKGVGNIINLPLPAGTGGARYRAVFEAEVTPALREFAPQLILASAGFDAHRDDPLAGLGLVEEDYRWIGGQLSAVADECCGGKVVSMLEGGYDLRALAASTVSYLSAFAG